MKESLIVALVMLVSCSVGSETDRSHNQDTNHAAFDEGYNPSDLQIRVDQSFSDVPINTPFVDAQQLTIIVENDCEIGGECDWRDERGVRHLFWGDSPRDLWVVVKSVKANEFVNRSIPALGIGMARSREDVLTNVRAFSSEIELNCTSEDDNQNCGAMLMPGWIRIWFDSQGQLIEVRFDGYHFI